MKPKFQTKFLLHFISRADKGFSITGLLIPVAILGLLALIVLPSFFNRVTTSKQGQALLNLHRMRAGELYSYQQDQKFIGSIQGLRSLKKRSGIEELGYIRTQGTHYRYGIELHGSHAVTLKGASLQSNLKSYVMGIAAVPGTTSSKPQIVQCESKQTKAYLNPSSLPNITITAKGELVCPEGFLTRII